MSICYWFEYFLVFDNELCMLFSWEDHLPAPSFPLLSIGLCVKLKPHGLFSVQYGMFLDIIFVQLMFS